MTTEYVKYKSSPPSVSFKFYENFQITKTVSGVQYPKGFWPVDAA